MARLYIGYTAETWVTLGAENPVVKLSLGIFPPFRKDSVYVPMAPGNRV
jgi:hypothetical protein